MFASHLQFILTCHVMNIKCHYIYAVELCSDALTHTLEYSYSYVPSYVELTSVASEVSGGGRQGGGGGVGGAGTGMGHDSIISSKWARDEDINRMIRCVCVRV